MLLYVNPLLPTGKLKQITRTIPAKSRNDADGGLTVELRLAEELEKEFMHFNTTASADSRDGVAVVVGEVTVSVVQDGGDEAMEEDCQEAAAEGGNADGGGADDGVEIVSGPNNICDRFD